MAITNAAEQRIKLHDLRILRAVAAAGSMVKASEEIALSQSAISKAIAEMERTLGAALLERNARGITVTPAGLLLLGHAAAMLDELRQGVEKIAHIADPSRGEVRIGTTEPMTNVVAAIIGELYRRYPLMTFRVEVTDTAAIVDALRDRTLDVGITRWVPGSIAPDLKGQPLFRVPLGVMADRKHRLMRRTGLQLKDLMTEQWTLSPPGSFLGQIVSDIFGRRKLGYPRTTVTTLSIYMRLNLLASGRFLTILPLTILQHVANRSWLRALDVDLSDTTGPIAAITLSKRKADGALGLFLAQARETGSAME